LVIATPDFVHPPGNKLSANESLHQHKNHSIGGGNFRIRRHRFFVLVKRFVGRIIVAGRVGRNPASPITNSRRNARKLLCEKLELEPPVPWKHMLSSMLSFRAERFQVGQKTGASTLSSFGFTTIFGIRGTLLVRIGAKQKRYLRSLLTFTHAGGHEYLSRSNTTDLALKSVRSLHTREESMTGFVSVH